MQQKQLCVGVIRAMPKIMHFLLGNRPVVNQSTLRVSGWQSESDMDRYHNSCDVQGWINCVVGSQRKFFIYFGSQRVNKILATKSTVFQHFANLKVLVLRRSS